MKINIDGINVNCEIKGEGYPTLILHGWGGCINSMYPVKEFFSKKSKTITIDFPGFGESDFPDSGWSVIDYTEMVKKLLDKLEVKKCNIIAHSFGGRVTIRLAEKYSQYVNKIILVDSGGLIPKRTMKYYFKVYTYKISKKFMPKKLQEKFKKHAGSEEYKVLNDVMKKVFVKVVNDDLKPCLKNIKSPTLIIWGENDLDTPLYMAEIMEKEIPDAGLVVLNDAGHFSYLDKSVDFNKIADNFLSE